jgi:hypothetical protein
VAVKIVRQLVWMTVKVHARKLVLLGVRKVARMVVLQHVQGNVRAAARILA